MLADSLQKLSSKALTKSSYVVMSFFSFDGSPVNGSTGYFKLICSYTESSYVFGYRLFILSHRIYIIFSTPKFSIYSSITEKSVCDCLTAFEKAKTRNNKTFRETEADMNWVGW